MSTLRSLACPKGMETSRLLCEGIFVTNSEQVEFLSQESQANKSLIVSAIISDIKQKSAGQDEPPKGNRREIRRYQTPFIFTRTADCLAAALDRWRRLYADFKSSFLNQMIELG